MNQVGSYPTSRSELSFTEVVQLSNMASYGLPTNLLFCKICQTVYKEPKLLPCLHTYCQECLEKQTQESNKVICSLCGYSMIPPLDGISSLTTNIFAERVVKQYIIKIQEFATTEKISSSISNCNSISNDELFSSLMEKAKYSPNSLSLFSLKKKRENLFNHSSDIQSIMESVDNKENPSPMISEQPDLVQSHTSAVDSVQNIVAKLSSHMDHKLMALQGEALRVTYAIDSINQTVNQWRDNKYQLKRKVEERSNILQHQIKRHEKRLLAEIDSRYHEDKVMKDAEKSKHVLRQNLKGILQTVEFLKQVHDFATDDEMIMLKDRLMSCSVNISEVQLVWQELVMEISKESPEVLMVDNFGKLTNSEKSSVVFIPGSLEIEKDSSNEENNAFDDSFFADQIFSYTRSPLSHRRLRHRYSRVSETDTDADGNASDASVTVDQFRKMRESFKQKRRELLEGNVDYIKVNTSQEVPILVESPYHRLSSSKRKRVRSYTGATSNFPDNPDLMHESHLYWAGIQPLPPNATSRDITDRNEISGQMAHLSHENCEDKIKRMQNLRESWKKRKEVLMKNDGYISPTTNSTTFEYDQTIEEVIEDTPISIKQSRMKQLKNRFSQIRQHFKPESNSTESSKPEPIISTDEVIRRNKPKEKKEKRWSGIFRTKESKRKSTASVMSTEFVMDENESLDFDTQTGDDTKPVERKRTDSAVSRTSGLTRKKLHQIRDSVRKKTQRWRSITSA